MRELSTVIDQLLDVIPQEQRDFREQLNAVKSSVHFAAPEMVSHWWTKAAHLLTRHIPVIQDGWHFKVLKIWKAEA